MHEGDRVMMPRGGLWKALLVKDLRGSRRAVAHRKNAGKGEYFNGLLRDMAHGISHRRNR